AAWRHAPHDRAVLIRRERADDRPAVRRLHAAAFARAELEGAEAPEARLVDDLRETAAWLGRLSLVGEVEDAVVGHVVCSRATLEPGGRPVLGLGPIGVLPTWQGQGIGSALMHAVLAAAGALDEPLVCLLGEPDFYRRFGFEPAGRCGVLPPDPAWSAHFQIRPLDSWSEGMTGTFRYAEPFGDL
ncbi:MAG: GNAT family N-acetyltransferase, partial [Pseudonocardiaceae bacterium]